MKRLLMLVVAAIAALGANSAAQRAPVSTPRPLVTAPDAATPIRLERASVDVETIGSLARTTVLLTLRNPNARLLESSLEFPLQPGQQVTAFALDMDGVLRDAVPVPKARGRQVFESIERRNVDPALLEQTAGNHFRLRIYPIPANGTRQVRLSIDETLRRDGAAWRLTLPAALLSDAPGFALHARGRKAPEIVGAFSNLRLQRDGDGYTAQVARSAIDPAHGLALRFPASASQQTYAGVHDDTHYVLAEFPVVAASTPRAMPRIVGLLWDASASGRKRDHAGEFALLDRYFRAMGNGIVSLRLLRDTSEDAGTFEVRGGDWSMLRKALSMVVYDGATDLADWAPASGVDDYLLVSDGLQNYGGRAFPALASKQRLYALASSAAGVDATRLAALAEARGGRLVTWQGVDGVDAAARALLQDAPQVVAMAGEGIADLVAQSRWLDDGMLRVAGRLQAPRGSIRVTLQDARGRHEVELPVSASDEPRAQVPQAWAAWTLAALSAEPERNRAAIARLGGEFALVTAGTSLLVLDDPADYVRYDIPAPAALQAQVAALRATQRREQEVSRSEQLDEVAEGFAERIAWWERVFPKGKPPVTKQNAPHSLASAAEAAADAAQAAADAAAALDFGESLPAPAVMPSERQVDDSARRLASRAASGSEDDALAVSFIAPPSPPPPPPAPAAAMDKNAAGTLDSVMVTGARIEAAAAAEPAATIRLQPWEPDSPAARRLRDAPADRLYALYLDERDSHADSTAFYLDVADLLLQRGRRDEALRVLSSLAELQLENRHVLRVLGYRLMQAKAYPLAAQVFRQVLEMADEEPQSHRDLALALAADGQRQEAIRRLYDVVAGEWDDRFAEIALVALNELNQIVATSPQSLDTAFIDRRLLKNMPLDLRVVLAWDSDNSDMDLWVTDPNGEKCYYAHPLTYQGGLISDDFTGGYGPEEFVLRHAKPGKYKVEAHYFGDRQQIVTGATTLSLKLSTGWGGARQQDQTVTLRLSGKNESVLVGEFEVK